MNKTVEELKMVLNDVHMLLMPDIASGVTTEQVLKVVSERALKSATKLTAIIEQMEKAEPVGHFKRAYGGQWTQLDPDCWPSGSEDSTPLYTAAPAAVENLWQPIETAPECKSVLACNSAGYIGRAIFVKGKWEHIGNPTHWMPLPNPPAMKGEK